MGSVPIQIVDENDLPVGSATKQEAWDKGLIHRVVRIMIENKQGQVLLQHRHPSKDLFPNCWDNSAAGHVDAGEDYDVAAIRELEEELGVRGVPLVVIGNYYVDITWKGHKMKRFCRTYKAKLETLPHKLEAGKVDDVRWFTPEEIRKLIAEHPDQVTDGLQQVMERYYSV